MAFALVAGAHALPAPLQPGAGEIAHFFSPLAAGVYASNVSAWPVPNATWPVPNATWPEPNVTGTPFADHPLHPANWPWTPDGASGSPSSPPAALHGRMLGGGPDRRAEELLKFATHSSFIIGDVWRF